jgi:hypothetical protein
MEIVLGVQERVGKLLLKLEQFLPRIVLVRFCAPHPSSGYGASR